MDSSSVTLWNGSFTGAWLVLSFLCFIEIPVFNVNSVDLDQTSRSAASDLDLHVCQRPFYGTLGLNGLREDPFSEKDWHAET